MKNWVLQLNNTQSGNSFNSLVEFKTKRSPNQPNQDPIQSVIDQGNLSTRRTCLLLKETRPVLTRSMKNVCKKNLVLWIDQGNLRDCLKTFVFKHANDGTGWSQASRAHSERTICPEEVTLRHSTRTTSSTESTRRTSTSTFQEYHILQCNDHKAPTFKI